MAWIFQSNLDFNIVTYFLQKPQNVRKLYTMTYKKNKCFGKNSLGIKGSH